MDDILREHNAADGSNFICHWDTTHMACNCISYAINVQNQALRPQDMEELEDMCMTSTIPICASSNSLYTCQ